MNCQQMNHYLHCLLILIVFCIFKAYGDFLVSSVQLKQKPPDTTYGLIGRNVHLNWTFKFDKENIQQTLDPYFVFGIWNGRGYIDYEILKVMADMERMQKEAYDKKIKWTGNMSNDKWFGKITLVNVTQSDFRRYAVSMNANKYLPPLQSVFKLERGRIPKIKKFKQENKTIVCEASGLPIPKVQIYDVHKNRVLASSNGRVEVSMDESVYYKCTANSELNEQPVTREYALPEKQETTSTSMKNSSTATKSGKPRVFMATVLFLVYAALVTCYL